MKKRKTGFAWGITLTICVFAGLILGGYTLIGRIGQASGSAETQLVRSAVRSCAITCYAVEGAYPATVEYLETNYGLKYNKDAYIIAYDAFASNIMPDIRVLEKGAKAP